MDAIKKEYSNGEVTVTWEPAKCIHSKLCWTELAAVFNPRVRPWVNISGADTKSIVDQVKRCPSSALNYFMNQEQAASTEGQLPTEPVRIRVTEKGPYLVESSCVIILPDGKEEIKTSTVALCRCGISKNKPFCDGSHSNHQF